MSYKTNYSVYKITNIITNQHYIGVDSYFPKRLKQHQSLLFSNKHRNKYLQASYNKYGKENFTFELLEKCNNRKEMLSKEIELIKVYNSLEEGYNHTIGGEGSYGYKHSEESISKMSSWKRVVTPEWCKAISDATKGVPKKKGIKRINHPDYSKWIGGEKHPVAKLKQFQINTIRLKYLNGLKQRDLAKEYEISTVMLNFIILNKNWYDENYQYIKKTEFKNNKEIINQIKKYLYETLSTD
jgi:group I intron endonuclease